MREKTGAPVIDGNDWRLPRQRVERFRGTSAFCIFSILHFDPYTINIYYTPLTTSWMRILFYGGRIMLWAGMGWHGLAWAGWAGMDWVDWAGLRRDLKDW